MYAQRILHKKKSCFSWFLRDLAYQIVFMNALKYVKYLRVQIATSSTVIVDCEMLSRGSYIAS